MVSLSPLRDAALQLVKVLLADMPHIHPNDPVLAATFAAPKNARKTGGSVPAAAAAAPPAPVSATATPSSSAKSAPADPSSSSSSGAGSVKKRGRSPVPDHPSADGSFVKRSSSRLGAASSSPSKTRGGAAAARARKEDGEEEEEEGDDDKENGDNDGDEEEDKEDEEDDDDEEDAAWTTDHVHVTNRAEIAKYFDDPKARGGKKCPQVLFVGHVIQYAPPSRQGAGDQLYKIQYEDDDTEDFDEKELKRAMTLYRDLPQRRD